MAPKQMAIPQPFSYLLPGQGLVAGVAIYSSIYVFGVGKIPFILVVVAAGLHFLLGLYFCFVKNRLRTHDLYLVPIVLVAGAGVWAGSLYYFAKLLDAFLRLGRITGIVTTSQPEISTWTKVGTSMTGLNVLIDIILVVVFIIAALKKTSPYGQQEPPYNPPTGPAPAPTLPVAPVTMQYQQSRPQQFQQQQPQQYYQVAHLSPIQQQQQQQPQLQFQQQPLAPHRIISSTSSDFKLPIASNISPATSPSPRQQQQYPQYQQQQQNLQTAQYQQHQRQQSFTSSQSQPLQQQQHTPPYITQYHQQQPVQTPSPYSPQPPQPSFSPSPQPPPTPPQPQQSSLSPSQGRPQTAAAANYDTHNRIEILRRLSTLQHPLGNWTYSPELASILNLWGAGGENITTVVTSNTSVYDITVLTHGLMTGLRDYIWTAQQQGREHAALSAGELASLQGVNWDLAWVGMGIERAGAWLLASASASASQQQQQQQQHGQGQIQGGGGNYR